MVDVRSPEDLEDFERTLMVGPITIVLVYADWCGHCKTFKKDIWSKLLSMKNKKVNLASVHHDMLDKTSQKDAKIKGYPSVLIVGNDKVPATFGDTNALPNYRDLKMLQKMVTAKPAFSAKTMRRRNAVKMGNVFPGMKPPAAAEDLIVGNAERLEEKQMGGGSLLAALTSFSRSAAPAFLLTGLALTRKTRKRSTRKKRAL